MSEETSIDEDASLAAPESKITDNSLSKARSAIESLSEILPFVPSSLSSPSSENLALSLLHDPEISSQISSLLLQTESGAGENDLCRWLYDTFQSSDPDLQLVVLRFLPLIVGSYLSRVALRKPLAGFEAILLAVYAHETTCRSGQSITVSIPDISHPSLYHESKMPLKNNNMATELKLAVISPSLEPHGTIRSTRRARIVGVALELYYSKIFQMPVESKIDFCKFCVIWAGKGETGSQSSEVDLVKEGGLKEGRIPLPWELFQPVLRILGHCLLGPSQEKKLQNAASVACRSLYARAMQDINSKAILATRSLLRLKKMTEDSSTLDFDPTVIPQTTVISL